MGSCYVRKENYNLAKKFFLIPCKISPTCETWLGLGIALYHVRINYSIIFFSQFA